MARKKSLPVATPAQRKQLARARNPEQAAAKLGVTLPEPTKAEWRKIRNASDPRVAAKKLGVRIPTTRELHNNTTQSPEYFIEGRWKGSGRYSEDENPHVRAAREAKQARRQGR